MDSTTKQNCSLYVLVTPARNEAEHIEKTIQSVISQTILPKRWIIVNDGSTDGTNNIVRKYLEQNDFITLIQMNRNKKRDFASKVHAQLAGVEQLMCQDYDFLGFIDADISFDSDCFERIFDKFKAESKLGVAGGFAYERHGARFKNIFGNRERNVGGLFQIFRRECFEQISYIPLSFGGEDTVAENYAMMKGWLVKSFPEFHIYHYKSPASFKQTLIMNFRFGQRDYACRTHPIYELGKCLYRVRQKPYILSSLCRLVGYCSLFLCGCSQEMPEDVTKFMRAEQIKRLNIFRKIKSKCCRSPRVCIIAKYRYPMYSRLRQQARVLSEAGIYVDIFCLRGGDQVKTEESEKITVYRICKERPRDSFVKYLWFTFCFGIASFFKLIRLLVKKPPDVLVIHTLPEFMVLIGIIHKILGKSVVLDAVDLSVEVFKSKWGQSKLGFLKPLVKFSERVSCTFSDRVLTASLGFKDCLIERYVNPDKITVMMNSADTAVFSYDHSRQFKTITRRARIFYHGTVALRFGLAEAIEAVYFLKNRIPETTFRIYGRQDSEYRKELDRKIAEWGLEDKVYIGDLQPHEKILEFIRASDIGIVPYRSDDFMNIAFSTKMFEYAASGLPIVASRLRSAESIFGDDCVNYAKPGNPEDLADKIAELCLNPKKRKNMVEAALKANSKVSGSVMSERFLDLIHNLIKK